ncbi:hypothetical protein PsorP6_018061 [Peronosclerospora sorghi]|uniref:Uncharacterized protein n=1 Tax=Peronosclerospora sorghi TaxID=230839 RepID=A0ACC0WHA2_9STRA|nr:hypothetical protein PsorP6_018061 [Peronosclerospora sorghi]
MVASNLKGHAAAWFTFNQDQFTTLSALDDALQARFIPPDLQERLRAERFCEACQLYWTGRLLQDMSEIDQITWFVHGLVTRTREEVSYRRCAKVSNAISVALEFERSLTQPRMTRRDAQPMEIDNVHMRQPSREDCRRKNFCFRCKKPGHRINDCHVKSFRGRRKDGPRCVVNSVQIRTPSLDESKMDESMSFRSYTINMARLESQAPMEQENRLIRKKFLVNGLERTTISLVQVSLMILAPSMSLLWRVLMVIFGATCACVQSTLRWRWMA